MRRGRPSMSGYFREAIVTTLRAAQYPVTVSKLTKRLGEKRGRPCGWDTVLKYLNQLCEEKVVYRQVLPTERGRKPLVLYCVRTLAIGSGRPFPRTFSTD